MADEGHGNPKFAVATGRFLGTMSCREKYHPAVVPSWSSEAAGAAAVKNFPIIIEGLTQL